MSSNLHPTTASLNKDELEDETKLHIAMFPWLAFGHIFPYLELAKLIAQKGHKISFISTPKNIDRLPKLPPNLSSSITFVKLLMPSLPSLPVDAEATSDLPLEQGQILKQAHDLLRNPMTRFLETARPSWILFDFAAFWIPEIARDLGIQTVFFSIINATCLGFGGVEFPSSRKTLEDFMAPPKWVNFPSTVALRPFELYRLTSEIHDDDSENISIVYRFMTSLQECDVLAVRSSWELEKDYLSLLADLLKKPVIPVGQLPPEIRGNDGNDDETWQDIEGWLDEQEKGSVVYVAFGSEAEWGSPELTEIALGLELSGLPFMWALRSRPGSEVRLPEGFEERVGRRGYICRRWAPQVKILAHKGVGVFLNHSGWSSVVESFQFSKPVVLLAFSNDQGLNLKLLEEKMMGFSIPRNDINGWFTRDAVADSLRLVVRGEEGKVFRENAKKLSAMFGDRKVQDKYVDEFLGCLKGRLPARALGH